MPDSIDVTLTFCRGYYRAHFGDLFSFDREYFCNVDKRMEITVAMQKALYERFGDLGLGDPDPEPRTTLGFDDTLNVTAIFGGHVRFSQNYTWLEPGTLSDDRAVEELEVPDLENTWPQTLFISQFDEHQGSVSAPGLHGIVDSAMDLRGSAFLVDLIERPDRAEKLLDVLVQTVVELKEFWDTRAYGRTRSGIALGGCSCCVVSPKLFDKYLLPRLNQLTERFGDGKWCSCGPSTHLLEGYAKLENVSSFRLGWDTDFKLARKLLGPAHIKATLHPARIAAGDTRQVERDVRKLLEDAAGGELSLVLINAAEGTPDENVRTIFRTVAEY